jgi:glucans biosynthesis protein C
MHTGTRLHYMDNLRALAMLAGVLFHAALAYSPLAQPVWPAADRDNSVLVDLFVWFLHLFRMPLFFLVAGFFTAFVLQRDGLAGLFRNRALRIGLPFVLFWPLLHLSLKSLTLHAAVTVEHPSPMLGFIRRLLESSDGLPAMLPGTGHLWFLYYLLILYVLVWVARSLELGWLAARVRALSPAWVLGVLPLLLVPALASVPAPHPAPESLFPQFWALGYYGAFFAFGYLVHGEPTMAERLGRPAPWLLAGSVLLYAGWLIAIDRNTDPTATASWHVALLQAFISVWMTAVCLVFGQRLLDRRGRLLRPLADAAYWTYIVHLPILLAIQYRLMDVDLPWLVKFSITVVATMLACLLSHRLLVRRSVLARMFGGGTRPVLSAPT